jgi:hypothetical protein
MLRRLVFSLLLAGLGLAAYDAGTGGPRTPARTPQTVTIDGGSGWPTPPHTVAPTR